MFKNLAKKLSLLGGIKSELEMYTAFASIGLDFLQQAGKRRTFKDSAGLKYSAYLDALGNVLFIETTLDLILNPEELSAVDYQEKLDEFGVKLELIATEIKDVLGDFSLFEKPMHQEMPYEQNALKMAIWQLPEMLFMLELKHEDKELPIRICIVIQPINKK